MFGIAGVLVALLAQSAPIPPASHPEFPRYDRAAWELQRKGLTAKAAERGRRRAPGTLETLELLLAAERIDAALQTLRPIVERRPQQMAQAFGLVARAPGGFLNDDGRDHALVLQTIVEAALVKLPALPRDEAARAERQLLMVDSRPHPGSRYQDRLDAFVEKYRGTEAAQLMELEILARGTVRTRREALDEFIRQHPEGLVGARAMFELGHYLSSTVGVTGVEPRTSDPTERFMRVVEIANQLQSGRYPPSEWVGRAQGLVTHFFWSAPTFARPNIDRVLDVFYAILRVRAPVFGPDDYASEHLVTQRLPDLFDRAGEGVEGVDRMLRRFAEEAGDPAKADYLHAVLALGRLNSRAYFYKGNRTVLGEAERVLRTERLTQALDRLARGPDRYARWALATLAAFHFEQLDFARARARYDEYLTRFPAGGYAWMAALRLGACIDAMGDTTGAIAAYEAAAARRNAGPLAAVMGRVAAARIHEAHDRPDLALAGYRRALAAWDNDYGREYVLSARDPSVSRAEALDQQVSVTQLWLRQRIERLTTAAANPVAGRLARARWLLEARRWDDARTAFEHVMPIATGTHLETARYGRHTARLRQALERVRARDSDAALRDLQAIAADRYDFAVTAAKIARASLLWLDGAAADADTLMREALNEWRREQQARPPAGAVSPLAHDVAAIRRLILQPAEKPLYRIVSSDVDVVLADGERTVVSSAAPLPGFDALFLDHDQRDLLRAIAMAFRTDEPNPPLEPLYRLLEWWRTFFQAGPVVWENFPVETHPYIWRLEFTDRARTSATARVMTSASSGHAVTLRKVRGVWQVLRTGRSWVA